MHCMNVSGQCIHVVMCEVDQRTWFFIGAYVPPQHYRRKHLWSKLKFIAKNIKLPWPVGGDLNTFATIEEKRGGTPITPSKTKDLN